MTPSLRQRLLAGVVVIALAGVARGVAAQAAAPTAQPNCYASVESWALSSAADCPLSAFGITLYGVIDVGGGYESHGAPFNGDAKTGVSEVISKVNNGSRWEGVPSGLTQSNLGVKISEQFAPNWFFIGDVNASVDPYSLKLVNGPKSLVDNNDVALAHQTTSSDSARSGALDNQRGIIGVSNSEFGTLTFGHQNSLSADLIGAYDPQGGAYAFSLIGNSSTFVAGTGDTELSHFNRSVKYLLSYQHVHVGAIAQVGGYDQRNNARGAYQIDLGGELHGLSIDAVYSHETNAVALSSYSSGAPTPDTLKATLADVSAGVIAAKYTWRAITVFGGYQYARLSTPSDLFGATATANGGTLILNGGYPAVVQANAYVNPKDLQVFWFGGRYKVLSNLAFDAAFYEATQNNYTNAATKYNIGGSASKVGIGCGPNLNPAISGATPQGANAGACAGTEYAVSALLDWRVIKRVDLYTGVMYSEVTGGFANGFIQNNNTAFTTGLRFAF